MENTKKCSTCGEPRDSGNNRLCKKCKAAYMREWRKNHKLTGFSLLKANCRSYANTYLKRGKITKEPCVKCSDLNSQMHHDDYSKPLEVTWLCRPCHLEEHSKVIEMTFQEIWEVKRYFDSLEGLANETISAAIDDDYIQPMLKWGSGKANVCCDHAIVGIRKIDDFKEFSNGFSH